MTPTPQWRTDLPPPYAPILIRRHSEHFPIESGYHDGVAYFTDGRWLDSEVRGWMHLDEAAQKLDAK